MSETKKRKPVYNRYVSVLTSPDMKDLPETCAHLHRDPHAAERCCLAKNRAMGAVDKWKWGHAAYRVVSVEISVY